MAYRAVADHVNERGLASPQSTFEGRAKLLGPLNILTLTIRELEHQVVAVVGSVISRTDRSDLSGMAFH